LRHLAAAIIRCDGKVAMVRGLDDGLLGDLWNFPSAFGSSRANARAQLEDKLRLLTRGPVRFSPPLGELRHDITFRSIHVALHPAAISGRLREGAASWIPLSRLPGAAISQLARKIAEKIREE
jgi:adenine-specific DNA glycosylase